MIYIYIHIYIHIYTLYKQTMEWLIFYQHKKVLVENLHILIWEYLHNIKNSIKNTIFYYFWIHRTFTRKIYLNKWSGTPLFILNIIFFLISILFTFNKLSVYKYIYQYHIICYTLSFIHNKWIHCNCIIRPIEKSINLFLWIIWTKTNNSSAGMSNNGGISFK